MIAWPIELHHLRQIISIEAEFESLDVTDSPLMSWRLTTTLYDLVLSSAVMRIVVDDKAEKKSSMPSSLLRLSVALYLCDPTVDVGGVIVTSAVVELVNRALMIAGTVDVGAARATLTDAWKLLRSGNVICK
jgi:hypothetical protein